MSDTTDSYQARIASFAHAYPGAHWVLCGYKGKPKAAYPGWDKTQPTPEAAVRHSADAQVGLIPARLGFTVLDVDEGNPLELALNLRPD